MTVYKIGLSKASNYQNSKARRVGGSFFIVLLVGLLVTYIVQTNDISTKGFEIRTLERQVTELERQVQQRQAAISTQKSLEDIKTSDQLVNFVAVERIQYLSGAVSTTGVAVR